MGASIASERRLLSEDEYKAVVRSHFPQLNGVPRDELIDLARWLRSQRNRVRDIIHQHRRVRRGKAETRGAGTDTPSERGIAAKKQIFSRALRRVNGRLDLHRAATKREQAVANLRRAVARKASRPVHPGRDGPQAKACRQSRTAAPKTGAGRWRSAASPSSSETPRRARIAAGMKGAGKAPRG
ncbi:MAG: hypothetical protein U1E33_08295 [Rhodospirillales bacterium]